MAANPFVYGRPVAAQDLVDRREELGAALELFHGGHNVRLSAPRRYGKTSLVQRLRADAEREGVPTVYVNFFGLLSLDEAVVRLERGYRALRGPLRRWMTGRLASLTIMVPTPAGSLQAGGAGHTRDAERVLHELLDLPRALFERSGRRVLVCFDEFQEVLSARTALDGAIRSVVEQHADAAAYVFAGSHPGMMRALFEDRERPFYGQARAIGLPPLAAEDLAEHVAARFEDTRRDAGGALAPLLALARGHPQRAMLLAHFLWERTPRDAVADEATFADALADVQAELDEAFERTWRGLQDGERRAVAAIAVSGGTPTHAAALHAAAAPRTTIVEALERLRDDGHAVESGGRWTLVDPLFKRWVLTAREGT